MTFAAQSYYERLLEKLNNEKSKYGVLFPQVNTEQGELVDLYMRAANNLGVSLNKVADRSGDARKYTEAMVYLTDSMRAWDALTRNPATMMRLDGTNLAMLNMKYITAPVSDFEPELYREIEKTLKDEKPLTQGASWE